MFFIYKTVILKQFWGNSGFSYIQGTMGLLAQRPLPDARQERLARRPLLHTREGWLARKPPPDARKLAGVGRVVRRGGNQSDADLIPSKPAVPDAHDTVGHRESTILEGFREHRSISALGQKSA